MKVNGYLRRVGHFAIVRDKEKQSIKRSVGKMKLLLRRYFKDEISEHCIFGSYSRGTILPRSMDPRRDVDYMVVFDDRDYQPQTYLNQLRRFVEGNYRSEICQSHPTIQLELNHIRFELVPAISAWWYGYSIPAKAADFENWVSTNPTKFNDELTELNKKHNSLIKPLIRIAKYWNAGAGYPFESYELEKHIVSNVRGVWYFSNKQTLKNYFFEFVEGLSAYGRAEWKVQAVERLQSIVEIVKEADACEDDETAIDGLQRILPQPWP